MLDDLKKQDWKPLGTHNIYREMFANHLERQRELQKKGRPTGWFWACFPSELPYVFDIINIFPEQYSAYCAAKMRSVELIDASIAKGYEKFMCDYLKCSVGSILIPDVAPLGGHCGAEPDFILDSRMCCYGHHAMSEVYSQLYNTKRFVLDSPFWTKEQVGHVDQLTKIPQKDDQQHIHYVIDQLKEFIDFLEEITGDMFDEGQMRTVFRISEETSRNLIRIAESMYAKPTPATQLEYRDFPAVGFYLSGSEYALEFSRKVRQLIEERVKSGEGVVQDERLRLMTHGIMPWHSKLYKDYEERGIVFPINPYVEGSLCYIDASRALESLVRRSIIYTNSEPDVWIKPLLERARRAEIDGAILFENTGCRPVSLCLRRVREALSEELGLPSVIVESPQCDPRAMSIERAKTKMDALIESLL